MPAPLMTRDGRHLATRRAPGWLRHAAVWAVPTAALLVLFAAASTARVPCGPAAPCGADPVGGILVGLLAASVLAVFAEAGVAAVLAGAFAVAAIVADMVQAGDGTPWWLHLTYLGYAGLCALVARSRRPGDPRDIAFDWLARTAYAVPAKPPRMPGPNRFARLAAAGMVIGALGFTAYAAQRQGDALAQQNAAGLVEARVAGHADFSTLWVALPDGGQTTVRVSDAADYPVGSRLELRVDSAGLRQPVWEGYDAMGWLVPAVALAGLAGAIVARDRRRSAARLALFAGAQPVSAVFVCESADRLAVYPADARAGEPAIAELLLWRDPTADLPPALAEAEEGELAAPQSALLYGVPAPGQWCTVVVDGEARVPRQPLRSGAAAPPFVPPGYDLDSTPVLDAPLRPEELATLAEADRADDPLRLRRYTGNPVSAALRIGGLAVGLTAVGTALGPFPPLWALGYCLLSAALAVEAGWRFWLRPRLGWHGGGLSGVGVVRAARFGWAEVHHILADRGAVVVAGAGRSLIVPAQDGPLWFGGPRSAEQLVLALRYARQRALADGTATVLSPPSLPRPARPVWLLLYGLALAVPLAALLHTYA